MTDGAIIGEEKHRMGWLTEEFERSTVRRFRQALADAKAEFARLPQHRREALEREFQEAADAARRHAQYNRPG